MDINIERPPRTAMEVYKMLPEGTLCEVIKNQLYMAPPPGESHQKLSIRLSSAIFNFVDNNKLGEVRDASYGVYIDEETALQPDILFISNENTKNIQNDGFHGAPDLVIEILSPNNSKYDLIDKKSVCEKCGVREYWVIDPQTMVTHGFYLLNGKYHPIPSAIGELHSKLLNHTFYF